MQRFLKGKIYTLGVKTLRLNLCSNTIILSHILLHNKPRNLLTYSHSPSLSVEYASAYSAVPGLCTSSERYIRNLFIPPNFQAASTHKGYAEGELPIGVKGLLLLSTLHPKHVDLAWMAARGNEPRVWGVWNGPYIHRTFLNVPQFPPSMWIPDANFWVQRTRCNSCRLAKGKEISV